MNTLSKKKLIDSSFDSYEGASAKLCKQDTKPNNLFINAKIEKGWYKSDKDWCIHCYAAYVDICKHVAYEFKIPINEEKHFKEEDLKIVILDIVKKHKGRRTDRVVI